MEILLNNIYFDSWKKEIKIDLKKAFYTLEQLKLEPHSFQFYTAVSVMASSKIEGEELSIDSFVNHKLQKINYLSHLIEKPNDLYNAYLFAHNNLLNKNNVLKAHKIITKHLLLSEQQGVLRKSEMVVFDHNTGKIKYEAALGIKVKKMVHQFWQEVDILIQNKLSIEEVFYYASFIHLVFVKIYPFNDGNGRVGRLLEKWFLAQKLGSRAWYIQSEKYYYIHIKTYYNNLAKLGLFYDTLDYKKSIPFLCMLTKSIINKK